jgi:hypothetical protein
LVGKSNHPPSLKTFREILLDDINEEVISVIRDASSASCALLTVFAIGVHGAIDAY